MSNHSASIQRSVLDCRQESTPLLLSRRSCATLALGLLAGTASSAVQGADLKRFFSPADMPRRAKWHFAFSKAKAEAKKTQRPLMVLFSGDGWCRPCKYLDRKVFLKDEFHQWAIKSVVLAKIEVSREFKPTVFNIFERRVHEEMVTKYRIRTIPSALFMTAADRPIGLLRFNGQSAREYVQAAQRIIQHRQRGGGNASTK